MAVPEATEQEKDTIDQPLFGNGPDALIRAVAFEFDGARAANSLSKYPSPEIMQARLGVAIESIAGILTTQDQNYHRMKNEGKFTNEMLEFIERVQTQTNLLNTTIKDQQDRVNIIPKRFISEHQQKLSESAEDIKLPLVERVRSLADNFSGQAMIVCDGDGTLTTNPVDVKDEDGHILERGYLQYIPGSRLAEESLARKGRERFSEVFARHWQTILTEAPELFKFVGRELAHVREGSFELLQKAKNNGATVTILTANFEPVANGILQQNPQASDGVFLWGVTPTDLASTDKEYAIRSLAYTCLDNPVIYIGDGKSCIPAALAKDCVLVYFALAGSDLETYLKKNNIRHFTYTTLTDVQNILEEIGIFSHENDHV